MGNAVGLKALIGTCVDSSRESARSICRRGERESCSELASIEPQMSSKESSLSEAAKKEVEKKYIQTSADVNSLVITGFAVDGAAVNLEVGCCNVKFHPYGMLNSRFFRENHISAVKFTSPKTEFFVERISDKLFNCIVTKGKLALRVAKAPEVPVVYVCSDGNIRVTNMEIAIERCVALKNVTLIEGVSLQAMLHDGNWTTEQNGTHVLSVADYRASPKTSLVDVNTHAQSNHNLEERGGGDYTLFEESKLCDGSTNTRNAEPVATADSADMVQSRSFVERISDGLFNYVVIKGALALRTATECIFVYVPVG